MLASVYLLLIYALSYGWPEARGEIVHSSLIPSTESYLDKSSLADDSYQTSTSTEQCLANSAGSDHCNYHTGVPTDKSEIDLDIKRLDRPHELKLRLKEIDRSDSNNLDSVQWPLEDDKTLRQVILIHRHGDRTPINFPPKDDLESEPFWDFHGRGQLTNRGKARLYMLGKLIRSRYDDFMDRSVNKNQRISRSSGSLRCIESAQSFLSGFLDLNSPGSSDAKRLIWDNIANQLAHLWQPSSVQSVPAFMDGMLAESAVCNKLNYEYMNVIDKTEEAAKIKNEYQHEANVLNSTIGFEVDHFYKWFWASSLIEVEASYFPDKVKPEIMTVYKRLQQAGNLALGVYISTLTSKRLRGGLLINDMINNMEQMRNLHGKVSDKSSQLKKFVHYSAHDLTLVVLLGMLNVWDEYPTRPDYASSLVMELHKDQGEWFVKVFYMSHVPSKPVELQLKACQNGSKKGRCTMEQFRVMLQPYLIESWNKWMIECENSFDSLNPYAVGS